MAVTQPVAKGPATVRRRFSLRADTRDAYLMLLPWILGFLIWTAGPMITSAVMAFMDWDLIGSPQWIGLGNFTALFEDKLFYKSLGNTLFFVGVGVPSQMLVALLLAMALNLKVKGIGIFRTLFYLPSIIPAVASSILWLFMFNPNYGVLNWLLGNAGAAPIYWLSDPATAKLAIIFMGLWGVGGQMVILLAGLQGVPPELHDAAAVDGAGNAAKFWRITLPLLTPSLFFVLVMGIINSFQVFTTAFILTGGGPKDSTLFYMLHLYHKAFQDFQMGYASAMAWVLFVIILILTLIQFKMADRWVYYEGDARGDGK